MRILIVNYEYPPVGGGAGTAAHEIGKALIQLGHQVSVLTGGFRGLPSSYEEDGVIIHRIPSLRRAVDRSGMLEMASFLIAGLFLTPGVMRRHQIEGAIIFFSLPGGPIGLVGRWLHRVPYVVSLRGGDVPGAEASLKLFYRIFAPIRRAVLRNSIAIVANSDGLQKMAEAADPFAVRVIPNGVDTDFFRPGLTQSKSERPGRPLRILFVGRFQRQKNLVFLFEQLVRLPLGTFELHLVGDGPQRKRLRDLADKLGLAGSIIWHGWLPRAALPSVYQSADCLVNPSAYEGMPNAVLEAMACGLPVIASNVSGNDALVLNGQTGFLFDLDNRDELPSRLKQLDNADLRVRLGQAARSRAVRFFSWKNTALEYAGLFGNLAP